MVRERIKRGIWTFGTVVTAKEAGNTQNSYEINKRALAEWLKIPPERSEADLEEQKIRTDRAKRARDQEIGDTDNQDENIRDFLKAMRPTQEDLDNLFADEVEEEEDAEGTEEASEV